MLAARLNGPISTWVPKKFSFPDANINETKNNEFLKNQTD